MLSAVDKRRVRKTEETFARLVGRFILAFGHVENATYFFIRDVPDNTLQETASSLPLGKRIDLVLEILNGHGKITQQRKDQFAQLLKDAKRLSHRRNVYAHSPVVLEVWHHPKYNWTKPIRMLVGSVKTREKVTIQQLRKEVGEAEKLEKRLYAALSRITRQIRNSRQ